MLRKIVKDKEQKSRSRVFITHHIHLYFTNKYKGTSARWVQKIVDKDVGLPQSQKKQKVNPAEEYVHFYDIKKEWNKLTAAQVLELLIQEFGLALPDWFKPECFFEEFLNVHIESDREEDKHDDLQDEVITKSNERIRDSQRLEVAMDYLKSNMTVAQLARKHALKYPTALSIIKSFNGGYENSKLWYK